MSKVNQEVRGILRSLLDQIVPPGMTPKERDELAKRAGISPNTLRSTLRRKSINADTLFRLLIARGVPASALANLDQAETTKLSKGEAEWQALGRQLDETEKLELASLVRFLRSRWVPK